MIGTVLKPWTFANNTETADGVKVNQDFDILYQALNEVITALNATGGTRSSLLERLSVSLNDDGTIKASALPVGSYDVRTSRSISADDEMVAGDSIIYVDTTAGDVAFTLLDAAGTADTVTVVNTGLTGYSANIIPAGTNTIMGLPSYSLTVGGESAKLAPNGAQWWRIG